MHINAGLIFATYNHHVIFYELSSEGTKNIQIWIGFEDECQYLKRAPAPKRHAERRAFFSPEEGGGPLCGPPPSSGGLWNMRGKPAAVLKQTLGAGG